MQEIIADWQGLTVIGKFYVVLAPTILMGILAINDLVEE